jgi:uncharacterized membrane protein
LTMVGFIILTWTGGKPVEWPYEVISDLVQLILGFFDLLYIVGFEVFILDYELYQY